MKKNLFTICCLLATCFSFGQWDAKKYNEFWDKGDSLYDAKDYKNSALAYSSALAVSADNISVWESWITARSWCRAKYYDSAFYCLNLPTPKNVTFSSLSDILTDNAFNPLHSDKRWQRFKDDMFLKAYKNFLLVQKEAGAEFINSPQNDATLALALGNNTDSAFSHLNNEAYQFLRNKKFNKAYKLFKISIDNFPPNYTLFQNMVDYYMAIGDMGRAYIYFSRAEVVKYKKPVIISDTLLKLDSAINAEYQSLSKITGSDFLPPEYLTTMVANAILRKGMPDKAYTIFKQNIENYPNSYTAYKEMGNFYLRKGDKEKADEYNTKSLILQYKLPSDFFQSYFNLKEYLNSHYKDLSKNRGDKIYFSQTFYNSVGNYFLSNKMFDKAEIMFKTCVEQYPQSLNGYTRMSTFYKTTGDKIKEDEFKKQAQAIKSIYQQKGISGNKIIPDTTYNVQVSNPACLVNCPTILFNAEQVSGGWSNGGHKPFANLMANDGFKVVLTEASFTKQLLAQTNVVMIVTPRLIKNTEIQVLNDWIRDGGSLLAVTHHDNLSFDDFLQTLGVQTQEINVSIDSIHSLAEDGVSNFPPHIVFSEKYKSLGNHPIIRGRNNSEKIHLVKSFGGGRSIIGPPGSSILLAVGEFAIDYMNIDQELESRVAVKTKGHRAYGIAFTLGKGKVVVLSSAPTITALLTPALVKLGMNNPGSDNKQFALNIMRWLTGYLK